MTMAQAKRKQPANSRPHRDGISGGGLFLLGLAIGLFVALLVYVNGTGETLGKGLKGLFKRPHPAAVHGDARAVAKPAIPGPLPKPPKPKFDFYTMLPEVESVLPNSAPPKGKGVVAGANVSYVLQAASYGNLSDADHLKAQLALQGLTAYIEKITIENRGDYYRVRVGPYKRLDKLDADADKLAKLGIQAIRLKVQSAPEKNK